MVATYPAIADLDGRKSPRTYADDRRVREAVDRAPRLGVLAPISHSRRTWAA